MPFTLIRRAQAALLLIATLLTGCASTRLVDAQVNSFSNLTTQSGTLYRFERLPSQQADAPAQDRLEQLAAQSLAKVGLTHADTASLSVQVSAVQRQESTNSTGSGLNIGMSLGWVMGNGAVSIGSPGALFPGIDAQPNYWRQVSLVMRDSATQAVQFESHASHEGRWSDSDAILRAMFDAALKGYPNSPNGARRVAIEIPR